LWKNFNIKIMKKILFLFMLLLPVFLYSQTVQEGQVPSSIGASSGSGSSGGSTTTVQADTSQAGSDTEAAATNYVLDYVAELDTSKVSTSGDNIYGAVNIYGATDIDDAFTAGTIASDATVTAATTITVGTSGGTSGQINFVMSDNDQFNITGTAANGNRIIYDPLTNSSYQTSQEGGRGSSAL